MIKNNTIQSWEKAIDTQDLPLIKELYSENAILLATFADKELKGLKEITPYFINLFKKKNLNVRFLSYSSQKIGNVEILSGFYVFQHDGLMNMIRRIPARYTFVTHNTKKGNKIINHHSSLKPNW